MLFNTVEFWLFFAVVLAVVSLVAHRAQNRLLLLASLVFYGAWSWKYLLLMGLSAGVDFVAGFHAGPENPPARRRLALVASVSTNLAILGVFKYFNFFVETLVGAVPMASGWQAHLALEVALPVGISFYTFQSMSYTIDVYRGLVKPIRSAQDFALYVSLFPQLVAGPIERATHLVPQIVNPRLLDPAKMESGIHLIAWGLFKKMVIADGAAHPVNAVFAQGMTTGPEVYLATVAFALQIYCDFSGYTDIARGTARMLGFELMLNFFHPYVALNPSDFWRRWHISLSTWLRDYLYIPLGGNRHGVFRTYRNLMITMLLGGLWHGARFNFVLWGFYHGLLLAVHRWVADRTGDVDPGSPGVRVLKALGMFQLTLLGWLLFRVESADQLGRMGEALATSWSSWSSAGAIAAYLAPLALPLVLFEAVQLKTGDDEFTMRLPWWVRVLFVGFCLSSSVLLNRGGGAPFIYFQF